MKRKTKDGGILEFVFYVCFFLVSAYLTLVLLSPLLIQSDNRILLGIGAASYISNILMCHQLPERSLELFGQYMPICSRDTGLFLGVFIACVASFYSRRLPSILKSSWLAVLSVVPLGIDGLIQLLGFWESTNDIRLATGLFAGFCISYYTVNVFIGEPKFSRRASNALLVLLPFLAVLLVASVYVGDTYRTKAEILSRAKAINNTTDINVFYIAPRAFSSSIGRDEYLRNYNDVVLSDVVRMGGGSHQYGVWVAVASGSSSNGRYVFASGKVDDYFYDAMSGELIAEFEH
ncbi:DUF2085 domain-containing protein [Candidatus Micrarchaeota archaeon]|nr:DUF2085 domain-containing protein [Candidatus Micrarchaeota archaeon]